MGETGMQYLLEHSDTLTSPYEAFSYDAATMNHPIRPHFHYFMEIIYMVEGTGLMECDGDSYVMKAGDMILFLPRTVHAIYSVDGRTLKYDVIKFDVNRLYMENSYAPKIPVILNSVNKSRNASIYFKEEEIRHIPVAEIFWDCCKELEHKNYGYDVIVHNKICSLLMYLIRLWVENGFDTNATTAYLEESNLIHTITAYIDAHIGEAIRVEDLAEMCGMSYSYFAKKFKQYYGRSCKEYIEFMQISKAEDMLLFTDFDLSYISQETGFSDSSHFIKSFRKWKGITPGKYRMRHHGG